MRVRATIYHPDHPDTEVDFSDDYGTPRRITYHLTESSATPNYVEHVVDPNETSSIPNGSRIRPRNPDLSGLLKHWLRYIPSLTIVSRGRPKTIEEPVTISVRVPEKIKRALCSIAKKENVHVSSLYREALWQLLQSKRKKE